MTGVQTCALPIFTAVEGVADAEGGVKVAGGGTDRAHAAEGELSEVTGERQGELTVEEAVVAEAAVVGVEAVFKLEAHGHAVAKIFGTLDADLGRVSTAAPEHSDFKPITDQGFEGWPLGRVRQPPQSARAPCPLLIRGS